MFRDNKKKENDLQEAVEKAVVTSESRDLTDLPADYMHFYAASDEESVPSIIVDDTDLKDFRLVINRLTRLTNITRKDKKLIVLRLRIIAQKMKLTMKWDTYLEKWKKIDLMLEHAELTLFDSIGGWKLDRLTESRRTIRVGATEEKKKGWF